MKRIRPPTPKGISGPANPPLRVSASMSLWLLLCVPALAQTNCPTVSDGSRILPVAITGAPQPVYYGSYDLNTNYLFIALQNKTNLMLTNVPQTLIVGHQTVAWASIYNYPSAIMQERSPCPLLAPPNNPIIAQ